MVKHEGKNNGSKFGPGRAGPGSPDSGPKLKAQFNPPVEAKVHGAINQLRPHLCHLVRGALLIRG
eukprot:9704178-Alexandrium_andersonii.AAC.1